MSLDRFLRDACDFADLLIAETFGHQSEDFYLQFGQPRALHKISNARPVGIMFRRAPLQREVGEIRRGGVFAGMGLANNVDKFDAIGVLQDVTDRAGANRGFDLVVFVMHGKHQHFGAR